MPRAKQGDGPWGPAIKHWLKQQDLNQTDLARLTGIEEKTISSVARGFDTTTRILRKVATALQRPLEDVLLSPHERFRYDERERIAREAATLALQALDRTPGPPPTRPDEATKAADFGLKDASSEAIISELLKRPVIDRKSPKSRKTGTKKR